jgi:hypothetical protein
LLDELEQSGRLALLGCDVLKVPHHGSGHAHEDFFRHPMLAPVVSVASQGAQGARSKAAYGNGAWQHPSTDVIDWLGGSHRVYLTQMHERRFDWTDLATTGDHDALYEPAHVLVETDGTWFRVVEVDVDTTDLDHPPTVQQTRRGNGTRWVRAR